MDAKQEWETYYQCSGCGRWYDHESNADSCCAVGVFEIQACSLCGEHIDICTCGEN